LRRPERGHYAHPYYFDRSRDPSPLEGAQLCQLKLESFVRGRGNTRRGAAETFTGIVFQDPVITAEAPSRLGGSVVTFTPGARTAWHSHPVGQTLFCLSGVGRICFKGEKPQVLNPGDTVNIPPDTMHWHGASPDRLFSHLALSEAGEQGQGTAWGTHVTDSEYNEAASGG
jgi:quercetin dioxygenase-like cupin family protein